MNPFDKFGISQKTINAIIKVGDYGANIHGDFKWKTHSISTHTTHSLNHGLDHIDGFMLDKDSHLYNLAHMALRSIFALDMLINEYEKELTNGKEG